MKIRRSLLENMGYIKVSSIPTKAIIIYKFDYKKSRIHTKLPKNIFVTKKFKSQDTQPPLFTPLLYNFTSIFNFTVQQIFTTANDRVATLTLWTLDEYRTIQKWFSYSWVQFKGHFKPFLSTPPIQKKQHF